MARSSKVPDMGLYIAFAMNSDGELTGEPVVGDKEYVEVEAEWIRTSDDFDVEDTIYFGKITVTHTVVLSGVEFVKV